MFPLGTLHQQTLNGGLSSLLTDLVSWWDLADETDSHGSNDLTETTTVNYVAGKVGNAADTATGDRLTITSAGSLGGGDKDFSISGWVNFDSVPSNGIVMSNNDTATESTVSWMVQYFSGKLQFQIRSGSTWYTCPATTFGAFSLGTWYFFHAYYDSVTNELGISINDGTVDTLASAPAPNDGSSRGFAIGGYGLTISFGMDGKNDSTCFHNRLLTSSEITELYNSGSGIAYPGAPWTPASLTGLLSWVEVGDIGDFYQDSAKTTAVTAVDDLVGAWVDKSGEGNDFLQTLSTSRPAYKSTHIVGDGTIDHLKMAAWATPEELMIGVRFQWTDAVANEGIFSVGPTSISGNPYVLVTPDGATSYRVFIDGGYRFTLTAADDDWETLIIRVTKPSTDFLVDVWHNGTKQTQYNAGTLLNYQGSAHYPYICAGYSGYSTNNYSGCVLAEGSFTDTNAEDLSDYLTAL